MMPSNPVPMKNIHEPFDAKSGRRPDDPEYIPEIREKETKSRRSSTEIIGLIYDVLPVETYHPISKIAEKADLDWRTTKRYLDLILHIQSKQKGDWIKSITPGEGQPIFARARK